MSTEHQITRRAASSRGLTATDLRDFLDELEKSPDPLGAAMASPKVRVSFGGRIKSITVTIPGGGEQK